jgi:TPR repeat protein
MNFPLKYHLPLDLTNSSQIYSNIEVFKSDLYETLHKNSEKCCWIRLTGPAVGFISAITSVAAMLSIIAESIFKGSLNIVGSPFVPQCSFCEGFSQIFCVTSSAFFKLPFTIFAAIIGLVDKTLNMAFNPVDYTREKWFQHNEPAKLAYEAKITEAQRQIQLQVYANERKQAESRIQAAEQALKHNPNDPNALIEIGLGLINGNCRIDNADNAKEGLNRLERAYELGHDTSILFLLSEYFLNGIDGLPNGKAYIDHAKAYQYNKIAAETGDIKAMMRLSSMMLNIPRFRNIQAGVEWFEKAAKASDDPEVWYIYARMLFSDVNDIPRDILKALTWLKKAIDQKQHRDSAISLAAICVYYPENISVQQYQFPNLLTATQTYKFSLVDVGNRRSEIFRIPYFAAPASAQSVPPAQN